jgi:hypothetical protein
VGGGVEDGVGVVGYEGAGLGVVAGAAQEQIIIAISTVQVNNMQEIFFILFLLPLIAFNYFVSIRLVKVKWNTFYSNENLRLRSF